MDVLLSTLSLLNHKLLISLIFLIQAYSPNHALPLKNNLHRKYDLKPFPSSLKEQSITRINEMFTFSFNNYMKYAFPHDELKPSTGTFTDSYPELGNAPKDKHPNYNGIALTLIDSLDSLLLFNKMEQFYDALQYLRNETLFDIDLRVHVFETNIRILGSLLSAHAIIIHPKFNHILIDRTFIRQYDNELLTLATDLGNRLMPAFDTKNNIPYAWINLKHGKIQNETRNTCTAGAGTLMLEFSLLSYFTNNPKYFLAAHNSLMTLFQMRNDKNLLGNTFNGRTLKWLNSNSGIGAGIDSYYEYLLKSYIFLGIDKYWDMFQLSYDSVVKYLRIGPWYFETNLRTNNAIHFHFNSLQCFWPSLQIMIGDLPLAYKTIDAFFSIWLKYDGLPERYLLNSLQPHSSERQYPLRPELIESIFYAYQSSTNKRKLFVKPANNCSLNSNFFCLTNDSFIEYQESDYYLWLGWEILNTIENRTRTKYGYTILSDVVLGTKGNYMPSYFLSETLKYLLLLFDDKHVIHDLSSEYLFTTEGHIFPMFANMSKIIESFLENDAKIYENIKYVKYFVDKIEKIDTDKKWLKVREKRKERRKRRRKSVKSPTPKINFSLFNTKTKDIHSLFIFQSPKNAICLAFPFTFYENIFGYDVYRKNIPNVRNVKNVKSVQKVEQPMVGNIVTIDNRGSNKPHGVWDWISQMFGTQNIEFNFIPSEIQIQSPLNLPQNTQQNEWILDNGERVQLNYSTGYFEITFLDHFEKLKISNLGTDLIVISNSVNIFDTKYSSFFVNEKNEKYEKFEDFSVQYLPENIGPTKYDMRFKKNKDNQMSFLQICYQTKIQTFSETFLEPISELSSNSFSETKINIASSYFGIKPKSVHISELHENKRRTPPNLNEELPVVSKTSSKCMIKRLVSSGILIAAESPSHACAFPMNLRSVNNPFITDDDGEEEDGNVSRYVLLVDRGECTFYQKISTVHKFNHYSIFTGVIIGNVRESTFGNIFTMGSNGIEQKLELPAFMMNEMSYEVLRDCSASINDGDEKKVEIYEILTRCEKENMRELNVHGINSHFFISSKSNTGFVVRQKGDMFTLHMP